MATSQPKVRTLIVDDSALIRGILRNTLSQSSRIEVVGMAVDGVDALSKIRTLRPDVVTLDVEMPRLNGIGVLERVVGKAPVSFVMISTLTESGGAITMEALQKGAFDYITKPKSAGVANLPGFRAKVINRVMAAARAKGRTRRVAVGTASSAPKLPPSKERGWLVAIGISCGGPQTLMEMLPVFPSDFPPMLITQHMPAQFTASFAARLNSTCAMEVREATDGQAIEQGMILIAPGDRHLCVVRRGVTLKASLDDRPKVSGHKPSADVMFASVARTCGPRSLGVVMTGMGCDGARGLQTLHEAGAWTIAQDEQSSLVYGMPKAAERTGCVNHTASLAQIPHAIARLMKKGTRRRTAALPN